MRSYVIISLVVIVQCHCTYQSNCTLDLVEITHNQDLLLSSAMKNKIKINRIILYQREIRKKISALTAVLRDTPRRAAIEQSKQRLGNSQDYFNVRCMTGFPQRSCVKFITSNWTISGNSSREHIRCGRGWHHVITPYDIAAVFHLSAQWQTNIKALYVITGMKGHQWMWLAGEHFFPINSKWMCELSNHDLIHEDNICVLAKKKNDIFCLQPTPCDSHTSFTYACLHDTVTVTPVWK